MASNYTSNYGLCQWEASDKVLHTEFNADNAKIDAALKAKADLSALNALTSTVNGKASLAALEALKTTVSSQATSLSLRNCCIVVGDYIGSGVVGNERPSIINFSARPMFFCVTCSDADGSFFAIRGQTAVWHHVGNDQAKQVITWGNTSVSWYNVANLTAATPDKQMNAYKNQYHYLALLEV